MMYILVSRKFEGIITLQFITLPLLLYKIILLFRMMFLKNAVWKVPYVNAKLLRFPSRSDYSKQSKMSNWMTKSSVSIGNNWLRHEPYFLVAHIWTKPSSPFLVFSCAGTALSAEIQSIFLLNFISINSENYDEKGLLSWESFLISSKFRQRFWGAEVRFTILSMNQFSYCGMSFKLRRLCDFNTRLMLICLDDTTEP